MSSAASRPGERAAELRRDFDGAFAEPMRPRAATEELLALRCRGRAYGVRLSQSGGLFADKTITEIPGAPAALRGLVGFRGAILPVYDLQLLLGLGSAETHRWLIVVAERPVALSFEHLEGYLQVPQTDLVAHSDASAGGAHCRDVARLEGGMRPILHMPFILETIEQIRVGGVR